MDRLPLNGEVWCFKCGNDASHTRWISLGGAAPQRIAYCDMCAWPIANRQKGRPHADRHFHNPS